MDLRGAAAIVTGGASGLGYATARTLVERGATVVIVDRQEELAAKAAAELGAELALADVTDEGQVAAAVEAASALGPLRALVNCAGTGRAGRTIDRDSKPLPLSTFEMVVRVNLIGTFNCIRLAAAAMATTEPLEDGARGAIVNTASVAAYDGQVGQAAYAASKGGLVGLTLPVARDLAAVGIRVNSIAPGLFDTPIYGTGEAADAMKDGLGRNVVFPSRLGTGEEFASLALELLTNPYMNGEVVRIDGAVRLPPR